jgi:hypothetical protein
MLNILNHKENASQKNTEILSHPSQNGYHQENRQILVGRGEEFLCTVGGSINYCNCHGNRYRNYSKN